MSNIGKLIFVLLCVKYRNIPDEYLAIMKIDRMDNDSGFTSFEYNDWIKTKEDEEAFLNNFDDKTPSQYLYLLESIEALNHE